MDAEYLKWKIQPDFSDKYLILNSQQWRFIETQHSNVKQEKPTLLRISS